MSNDGSSIETIDQSDEDQADKNIYLGGEVLSSAGGLVLGVGGDVSSLDVLNGDILDVESDVVAGNGLGQRFVVHLN